MNGHDDLDRMLSAWLEDPLTPPAPRYLDAILERTRRMPQRPAWASLERWLPVTITLRHPAISLPTRPFALGLALLLALLIALSSLPFLAGALLSPAPEGGSANGLIAFDRDGDIYVVDSPHAEPRLLVGGPEEDVAPFWSPDGAHLAFSRIVEGGEVPMLTDASGSMPVALTREPLVGLTWWEGGWSPDSSAIVVSSELPLPDGSGTASTLSIVPADGSGDIEHLGNRPGPGADLPAWRPGSAFRERMLRHRMDERRIAVLFRRQGDPAELHYIQTDDRGGYGGLVLGVDDMAGQRTAGWEGQYDFLDVSWSPDGESFAYHTANDVAGAPDGNAFRVHVAGFTTDGAAEPAGRNDTMVEFDPLADDEANVTWSPDGTRIAFESYDQGMARLVIMPVPAASALAASEALATPPLATWTPGRLGFDWAPDGSALILVDLYLRAEGVPVAYLVDAASGELEALDWKADSWPSWQQVTSG